MNNFERELESELHRILDPMTAAPVPARRVTDSGGTMKKLLGGVSAALGVKLLTGIAVAAAAATVAVAATEVASTGSLNPVNWGQQVKQQVADCKASAARLGVQGIGQCVSQFAKQHGQAVSSAHRASDSRGHGQGNSNGNSNGHAKDKNKSHGNGNGSGNSQAPQTSSGSAPADQAAVLALQQ